MSPESIPELPKLLGPFRLTPTIIDRFVKRSPGVYMLARTDTPPGSALFIGRSREDLRYTLHSHLPENEVYRELKRKQPDRFFFLHLAPERILYNLECALYHKYKPELNKFHPSVDSPSWSCPYCEIR